jgi:DNA-binding response OmpR family regulator
VRKVILFMDNRESYLEPQARLLEAAGYSVLRARSVQQAESLLKSSRIHLAILDVRMEDENDDHDISGLVVAQAREYRPLAKIVLTAYPSYQYVRSALSPDENGRPYAINFLDKDEGPEALLEAVKTAFARHVRIDQDLHIQWSERSPGSFSGLLSLIQPEAHGVCVHDASDELEDLLRKSFYGKAQITIDRTLWHRGGRVCVAVLAHSPHGTLDQRIFTCGSRGWIEHEAALYREFTPKTATRTVLADLVETVHFGGAAYELEGADLEVIDTFEAFYRGHRVSQIKRATTHLFEETLSAWHEQRHVRDGALNGSELQRERLALTPESAPANDFQRRAQSLADEAVALGPTRVEFSASGVLLRLPHGTTRSYPNPLSRLYHEKANGMACTACVLTPGTLTAGNVMVDPDGRTWLTDFAEAGPAPLLWNYTHLEAEIRFNLPRSTDLRTLHEFETRLVTPRRLNERLDSQDIDAPFRKALAVIQHIRRLADAEAGSDPAPYYLGLLLWALNEVQKYEPNIKYTPQRLGHFVHALLASAMICDRLMGPVANPIREREDRISKGIEINEATRQVSVEGRQVSLGQQEYGLLLYLYQHAGQLCTAREIVEEAMNDTYADDVQEADRIRTLVSRLRKKIEPYPGEHRYIRTIRGQGYILYPAGEEVV